MTTKIRTVAAAIAAFVLGCVAATSMTSSASPTDQPQRFEYTCRPMLVTGAPGFADALNEYAAKGWEWVPSEAFICFKRPFAPS